MWILYVVLAIVFIIGIMLLPPKAKNVALHILFFPIAWLICIVTFPFHYFKRMVYNKKDEPIAVKSFAIKKEEDFKIVVVHKDGREEVIKPFDTEEEENESNSINKE